MYCHGMNHNRTGFIFLENFLRVLTNVDCTKKIPLKTKTTKKTLVKNLLKKAFVYE